MVGVSKPDHEEKPVLTKVFPIPLKPGGQAEAEAIVEEFAPKGPGAEEGIEQMTAAMRRLGLLSSEQQRAEGEEGQ